MEVFLIKAFQLILSLAILVVLHEFGHFIPAKIFKTRVEKFYLFFDVKFSLFKKKIGETVYGIGWLLSLLMLTCPNRTVYEYGRGCSMKAKVLLRFLRGGGAPLTNQCLHQK